MLLILLAAPLAPAREEQSDRKQFGAPLRLSCLDGTTLTVPQPEAPATVLIFLATDCPIANKYAPEIRRIQDRFAEDGIVLLRVYDSIYHEASDVTAHTRTYEYTLPAILDPGQELAQRSGAGVTPEAVVITPDGEIAYRGRIDDRYIEFGRYRQTAKQHDLIDAITAVRDGHEVTNPRTKAIGCFIPQPHPEAESGH